MRGSTACYQCLHLARDARASPDGNLRVLPVDGPAAPDDLLGVGDRDQLDRGFQRLTPDERAILVLHHYAGYSLAEIAEHSASRGHRPLATPPRPSRHARRPRCRGADIHSRRANGMTDDRDLSLILDHWLSDGPTEMPIA